MDLPWKFPDRHEEARKRAAEFQRLPSDERWQLLADLFATGMILAHESPHRRAIHRLMGRPDDDRPTARDRSADCRSPRALPDLLEGAARLCETARRRNVPHALIGGVAAGFRTYCRFYRNISLLIAVSPGRLPVLLADLRARGFGGDIRTALRQWATDQRATLSFRGIPVDWLRPAIPLARHVLDRATDESWLGHSVRVASAEGLILLKLLAYRSQDVVDIENLVAIHRDTLDLDWIRSEWATVAAADDPRMRRVVELVGRGG